MFKNQSKAGHEIEDEVLKLKAQNGGLKISIETVTGELIECRTNQGGWKGNEDLKREVKKLTNDLARFTKGKANLDLLLGK